MSDFESDFMDEDYEDYEYSEDESDKQLLGPSQASQLHTQATFTSDGGFGDDNDDEDFFGDGGDFEPVLNGLKKKKPWEVDFAVYNPHDLQEKQEAIVSRLEPMLALSRDTTSLLLHEFLWKEDPLLESFLMDRGRTLARVGLPESPSGAPQLETGDESFTCEVCFCGGANEQFLRLSCGHRFCGDCYTTYISGKVLEGESWRIRCAAPKCTVLVGLDAAQLLLQGRPELERYKQNLTRSFVKELSTMAWCPAPNCEYAVECQVPQAAWSYTIPTVHCRCGASFCFGCRLEDHVPAPCNLVARWQQKCKDDSETSNWIKANTKECI
ncbi:hypothetical protein IWW36_005081, partial [Coemansia brasiliensis]